MANIIRRGEGSTVVPRTGGGMDPFDVMREMLSLDPLRALFGGAMGLHQMPTQNFMPHFEVRETDDPKSDVLSNLIDLESDGQPEYRLTASIDGAIRLCERRAFLGFWRETDDPECFAAVERCH